MSGIMAMLLGSSGGAPRTGYFLGGQASTGVAQSAINSVSFQTDAVATLAGTLASARKLPAALRGLKGYVLGGITTDGTTLLASIEALTYATQSMGTLAATLSAARTWVQGTESQSFGYVGGGRLSPGTTDITSYERLTFSDESRQAVSATMTTARSRLAGATPSDSAGYFLGGTISNGNTSTATAEKLLFSGETNSQIAAALNVSQSSSTAMNDAANGVAYLGGGWTGAGVTTSGIRKFSKTTETSTTLGVNMPVLSTRYFAAVSGPSHGYWGGNDTNANTYKFTYSTETYGSSLGTLGGSVESTQATVEG